MERIIWLGEALVQAIVCADKTVTKDEIETYLKTRPSGTANGWQISDEEKINPIQCADHEDRQHWILIC